MSHLFRKEIAVVMAKKYHIHRFLVNADKQNQQFYFPANYKVGESVFVLGNRSGDQIGIKIRSTEILPKDFNANLISFTGNLSRNQVRYPLALGEPISSALVEIDYKRDSVVNAYEVAVYFEVIEQ